MALFNAICFLLLCFGIIQVKTVEIDCSDIQDVPEPCLNHDDPPEPSINFHESDCGKMIKSKSRGVRPYPCQYFTPDEIEKHLDQFRSGAAYICKNFVMEHYNWKVVAPEQRGPAELTEFIGMKEGQYVGTLQTYINMIRQVNLTMDGATQYADIFDATLGFHYNWSFVNPATTPNEKKATLAIVLVVIDESHIAEYISSNKMQMASGNEMGANGDWLPGGYLPTGKPEATINAIPKSHVKLYKIYQDGKFLSNQYDAFPYTRQPIQDNPCENNQLGPSATFHLSDCAEFIKKKDKNERPEPSTYFTLEQINQHLQKFVEHGAAYVAPQHILDHYNYNYCVTEPERWQWCGCTKTVGINPNQFISLGSTYTDMLGQIVQGDSERKYRAVFDKTLGFRYNQSYIEKKDVSIILIILKKDLIESRIQREKMRIPSGNEYGANSEWLPGGYLPTGVPEVVVDDIIKDKITMYRIYGNYAFLVPFKQFPYQPICCSSDSPQRSAIERIIHPDSRSRIAAGAVGRQGSGSSQGREASQAQVATSTPLIHRIGNVIRKCIGCIPIPNWRP